MEIFLLTPKYLENLIKLIKRIKSLDEFCQLENRLKLNPNYKDIFNYTQQMGKTNKIGIGERANGSRFEKLF